MELFNETSSQLRLQDQSKFIAGIIWICGTISILLWLDLLVISILLIVQPRSLTCQRLTPTEGNCEIVRLGGFFPPEVISINIPLGDLQGAKVEESTDSDGHRSQEVILSVHSGDISFAGYRSNSNYEQKVETVNRINQFVKTSDQNTLVIKERDIWLSLFIFPFFVVLLFGCRSILYKFNYYTFDKDLSKLIVKKQSAFGADITEHHLSEIIDVNIEATERKDDDGDIHKSYKWFILFASGDRVEIITGHNNDKRCKEIVDLIRRFLNLKSIE